MRIPIESPRRRGKRAVDLPQSRLGQASLSIGLTRLQHVGSRLLLFGGVVVAVVLYRNAIGRVEQYSPVLGRVSPGGPPVIRASE